MNNKETRVLILRICSDSLSHFLGQRLYFRHVSVWAQSWCNDLANTNTYACFMKSLPMLVPTGMSPIKSYGPALLITTLDVLGAIADILYWYKRLLRCLVEMKLSTEMLKMNCYLISETKAEIKTPVQFHKANEEFYFRTFFVQ